MASSTLNSLRDSALYVYGYTQGRFVSLPHSLSDINALAISKLTSLIALPLPFLSFLALPFLGSSSTSINLVFFYLTWSALVLSHDPLSVETYGTLAVRALCFVLPALGFLAWDCGLPGLSKSLKAEGKRALPAQLERRKVAEVLGWAVFNVLLSVALQAGIELVLTRTVHLRSALKVTSAVPLPWNMAKDVLRGLALRGVLHYAIHRYLLHTWPSPLKTWHLQWQHSITHPFSLVAAYDHPINYILAQWLPVFLPAYLFRFHVLTWHVLLALVSLEDLFLYSGYAALPSSILLVGMARRTDAHFATADGNFGHWGIMDLTCGTTSKGDNLTDDLQDEADKHQLQRRASRALEGAKVGMNPVRQDAETALEDDGEKVEAGLDETTRVDAEEEEAEKEKVEPADGEADELVVGEKPTTPNQRRSTRRSANKGVT